MSNLSFSKYQSSGNDFILIEDEQNRFDIRFVSKLCDRHLGIGADGLLLVKKGVDADFSLLFYNSDGHEAGRCGNALLSFFQFLKDVGYPQDERSVIMGGDILKGGYQNGKSFVKMGRTFPFTSMKIDGELVFYLDVGVPHVIVFSEQFEKAPTIRNHPMFSPNGANVTFVQLSPSGIVSARTFERGVEAETLACGTGAVAAAIMVKEMERDHQAHDLIPIQFPGGKIEIEFQRFDSTGNPAIYMWGKAHLVFKGEIALNFFE